MNKSVVGFCFRTGVPAGGSLTAPARNKGRDACLRLVLGHLKLELRCSCALLGVCPLAFCDTKPETEKVGPDEIMFWLLTSPDLLCQKGKVT